MMIIILLLVYAANPIMGFIIGDSIEVNKYTMQSMQLLSAIEMSYYQT